MNLEFLERKDFWSGVMLIAIGGSALLIARNYQFGSSLRMGPGYFPALLGLVLAGIGAALIIQGFIAKVADPIEPRSLEPLFLVLASVVSFGFLVERVGLIIAITVAILLVCFRRALANPLEVLVMIAALASHGVSPQASIGLVARNRPAQVAALFGLLAAGRSIVMLHAYQAREKLADEVRSLGLAAVIADEADWSDTLVAAAREGGSLGLRIAIGRVIEIWIGSTQPEMVLKEVAPGCSGTLDTARAWLRRQS